MTGRVNIKRYVGLAVTAAGIFAVFLAFFANKVGIDRDPGWGPARYFLLATGVVLALVPHTSSWTASISSTIRRLPVYTRVVKGASDSTLLARLRMGLVSLSKPPREARRRTLWIRIGSGVLFCFAGFVYVWVLSAGRMNKVRSTTDYYHRLAEGFQAGQTSLLEQPSSELLALDDPYNVEDRLDINYPWDVSLYEGRFYLYWGPSPALATIFIETFLPVEMEDPYLTLIFSLGAAGFSLLIVQWLWLEVFKSLPVWTYFPAALSLVFHTPLLWVLTRPAVYETAISSGQFFFLAGLFWMASSMWSKRYSRWRFLFAGVAWSFAAGSRVSLIPAIILISLASAIFWVVSTGEKSTTLRGAAPRLAYFLLPLLLGAIALGWYNFDRFGSVFELGHRYQLGRVNKRVDYDRVVDFINVPQNLFNYYLNPPKPLSKFPYLEPAWGRYSIPSFRYGAGQRYHTEQGVGALIVVPMVWVSAIPLWRAIRKWWQGMGADAWAPDAQTHDHALEGIPVVYYWLLAASLFALVPLLILNINAERHQLDFIPSLLLCAAAAFGYLLSAHQRVPSRFVGTALSVWLLTIFTVSFGFLITMTGYGGRFANRNPELLQMLREFFPG